MSDHLSDAFRANVRRLQAERGLSDLAMGRVVTPHHATQYRTQIVERAGKHSLTLATVAKYADALGVPVTALLNERRDEAA